MIKMILNLLLFIISGLVALYLYMTRYFYHWKKKGVREVSPKIFFGNVASCIFAKETPQDFLQKLYKLGEGEKMIGFYVLDKPYLMLRDPELIKNVFIKDFNNFSNKLLGASHKDILGRLSIFSTTNPPWKHIRHRLTPFFTTKKLKNMFDLMVEVVKDLEIHLDSFGVDDKTGKPIDIKETSAKLMTDIIGMVAYSVRFNSLIDPDAEFRKHGKAAFTSTYKRYLQLLSIIFIPALRSCTNAKFFGEAGSEFFKRTFANIIHNRMKSGIEQNDLVDMLINIKNNKENNTLAEFKFEDDAILAQASVFFTGGFETSSTTLTYALYHIAKNIEIQKKLKDELRESLEKNNGKLTYELLTTMPYLHMVIQETLRMFPILAWIDRKPENDYKFSGTDVTVEKGIPIILPMRAMHMDPRYFPNPEEFNPERFSEGSNNITQNAYFPFGEGPRNCIGIRLGFLQVKFGVTTILSKFEISLCKEKPIVVVNDPLNVFTHIPGEVYINFKKSDL